MKISVIITAFNIAKYVTEAIDSVLKQTVPASEIIVVDDGSTDNTKDVLDPYREKIIYHYQENAGSNAARNAGIKKSTGDLLALFDGDDLWHPEKLEKQLEAFKSDPKLTVVFSYAQNFYSPDLSEEMRQKKHAPMSPMVGHIPSSLMIRKEAISKIGLFNPEIRYGDFMDWYARVQESQFQERVLPDVLVRRRIHGSNISSTQKQPQLQYLKVLREALKRRKKKES